MSEQGPERPYRVFGYDIQHMTKLADRGRVDLGGFDHRLEADRRAQEGVLVDGLATTQVISTRDRRILGTYTDQEVF